MKKNYTVATHSYFRTSNLHEERLRFLSEADYDPKFVYPKKYNESTILKYLSITPLKSLECVLSSIRLQKNESELENFRKINLELFGEPSHEYARAALYKLLHNGNGYSAHKAYIENIIGKVEKPSFSLNPSKEVFSKYHEYFNKFRQPCQNNNRNVASAIEHELEASGLAHDGWRLKLISGHSGAATVHKAKLITLGESYKPRKLSSAERIAVHEVYGHAFRGPQSTILDSEGFALVLEQLLRNSFKFKRSYRYLAACLGWGVFGQPMKFREVFEIIWRLMVISSKYSESHAKDHAFSECHRVFRGGRCDLPGAVYLKDICYFSGNIKYWEYLSKNDLSYDDFVNIISGRSKIRL